MASGKKTVATTKAAASAPRASAPRGEVARPPRAAEIKRKLVTRLKKLHPMD